MLVIVPTPIGNLGDMTKRAVDALKAADVVCAEDTRVTGKLLAACGIEGKRIERLDENVIGARSAEIVQRVMAGETIAYCSDAGMPGVSDPGLRLVRAAREAGAPVEVLPGPTAAVTAYVASGSSAQAFYFGGFFPRKEKARIEALESLRDLNAALVFYESPHRLVASLRAIADVFSTRTVTVCRELTKLHEEIVRCLAPDAFEEFASRDSVKGEIAIVIDPAEPSASPEQADAVKSRVKSRATSLLEQGERPKDVVKQIASEFGIPRNEAYDLVMGQKSLKDHCPT